MRSLALLVLLATPAAGWEATSRGPVCILSHEEPAGSVVITHDPRKALSYGIRVTRADAAWTPFPIFAMRFEGPAGRAISTDRHTLSGDGRSVSVSDSGFGNLLDGLQYNNVASAILGDQVLILPLDGAAPEVARFRDCGARPTS